MLLALDAGNTNITIGVFDGAQLLTSWRLRTVREQTADEWGIKFLSLLRMAGIDPRVIRGVAISSVVPPIDQPLAEVARRYFSIEPIFVSVDRDLGLEVRIDNPREAGADRLANAAAAFQKYGGPCVVVDLGTAINFDVVSEEGHFLGALSARGLALRLVGYSKRRRACRGGLPRAQAIDWNEHRGLYSERSLLFDDWGY